MRRLRALLLLIGLAVAMSASHARAQGAGLGTVDFPTSARSEEAQAHFLRGVAALHSFWYPVALEEFRAATAIEPDFMMGYWGEALAHNHPIWGDPQETEAARKVLAKIRITPKLTPREQAYLQAVKILYGPGEKPARDWAYAEAMAEIHRDYPEDLEAAAFYSLALLGTAYPNRSPDAATPDDPAALRTRMRAAAVAQEVYRKEPNHPGAAHYILHAFDDPNHAVLALPAARRYAEIAPAAPHALHMPSHIFLQLGMWPEAAASNEASWKASVELGEPNYHGLHWLLYAYLQQGRYNVAEPLLATMRESLAGLPEGDVRMRAYGAYTLATMAATFVVETERWEAADALIGAPPQQPARAEAKPGAGPYQAFAALARTPAVFARGLAAAKTGSAGTGSADAQRSIDALEATREQIAGVAVPFVARLDPVLKIQAMEIAAAVDAGKGDFDQAIRTMKEAIALTDAMPPPTGPPLVIKPPHELLGEILLAAGRPEDAARQFTAALFRHPDRARSLLGAARAAARSGDSENAMAFYSEFLRQWKRADPGLPELSEARKSPDQAGAQ
ncbi:tetratricopeptide repeat protein [Rhodospirillaceae bacterium SYSU D60014]|uniref:tetratricopeptide repeat protein n=1 Tax=Virgifigura deserti TaxID=2268457 RepID=UPI0013C41390